MIIDTSAIVAILMNEPERDLFNRLIEGDSTRLMSAANFVEAGIVIDDRFGLRGGAILDTFIATARIQIRNVDLKQTEMAREAYRRYGKGRHAAGLNFSDCFAYALATISGEPLLFKGTDFAKTDVGVATAIL